MDINKGDLVDFGAYGKLYVCNPNFSEDYFWVTDEESERNNEYASGWSISKDLAEAVIESYDDLDEEFTFGTNKSIENKITENRNKSAKLSKTLIDTVIDHPYTGKLYRYTYDDIFILDIIEWDDTREVQVEEINDEFSAIKYNGQADELLNTTYDNIKKFEKYLTDVVLEPAISAENEIEESLDDDLEYLDYCYYDDQFTDEELANIYGGDRNYCPDCGIDRYHE